MKPFPSDPGQVCRREMAAWRIGQAVSATSVLGACFAPVTWLYLVVCRAGGSGRRFEPLRPRFACTCSRERVGQMLTGLGREEVDSVIEEQGQVQVGCDFCGAQYRFDPVDVGQLFSSGAEDEARKDGSALH